MNIVSARARETFGGFIGEYRLPHWGKWRPVLSAGGKPRIFASDKDAHIAAYEALIADRYPPIRSEGERADATKSRAEELFAKVFPGKGRRTSRPCGHGASRRPRTPAAPSIGASSSMTTSPGPTWSSFQTTTRPASSAR